MEIGVDCERIARFNSNFISNEKLLQKIFTKKEIEYCNKKANPPQHFAARFAGKESLIKALSNFHEKIQMKDIEILHNDAGCPTVTILNDHFNDYEIKISLSHSEDTAFACAIVDKNPKNDLQMNTNHR